MDLTYKDQKTTVSLNFNGDSYLYFTNDLPTADSVVVSPSSINGVAGNWIQFQVQLKNQNGLLYHHSDSNGWYADPSTSLLVNSTSVVSQVVEKGVQKGTYMISVLLNQAQVVNLPVSFQINSQFIIATQKVSAVISPASVSQL